jgi:hypothetical protein
MKKRLWLSVVVLGAAMAFSCTPMQEPGTGGNPPSLEADIEVGDIDQYFYESEVGDWYTDGVSQATQTYNSQVGSLFNLLYYGAISESQYDASVVAAQATRDEAIALLDEQKYAEDHYGNAQVSYTVTNQNTSMISAITVWFTVTTSDASEYTGSSTLYSIPSGATVAGTASIATQQKKALQAVVLSYSAY